MAKDEQRLSVQVRSRTAFTQTTGVASGNDAWSVSYAREEWPVTVELGRHPTSEPHRPELHLTVTTRKELKGVRREAIEALAQLRIPDGVAAPDSIHQFGGDGTPRREIVPQSVQEFFDEAFDVLSEEGRKVALALRWRLHQYVPLMGRKHLAGEYSVDGGTSWVGAPLRGTWRVGEPYVGLTLEDSLDASLGPILTDARPVPVAHELLFEAQDLAGRSDRAALVVGVAALEVGVKMLVSTLVPGTTWLMEEAPSPPVEKMIREYLPTLDIACQLPGTSGMVPTEELIKEIKKAVKLRNELVHTGYATIDPVWLDLWLRLCQSLLFTFECFGGQVWAGQEVHPEHVAMISS